MADNDPPAASDTPAAKPATRRRTTTPAKAAAAKPRAKRAPANATADEAAAKPKAKAPPKPRSTKRVAAVKPTGRVRAVAQGAGDAARKATDKIGGTWGAAAIGAGVAVAGAAAAAAVLSFRNRKDSPADPATASAHQADGTDSSESFKAGIADEGSVPGKA